MAPDPKQRRAGGSLARKAPITVERITDAALEIVSTRGYDALTMRSVAALLDTGPASLYAHVVNKADLNELIIGRLCSAIRLPEPDAAAWRDQIIDVCTQLRDQYLKYPGVSRAAMAMGASELDVLRVAEGMLAILIVGGVPPQSAAWAIDALNLYVGAYTLEASLLDPSVELADDVSAGRGEPAELTSRFAALSPEEFPQSSRFAAELTAGVGHERFDFTLGLIVNGLS